MGEMGDACEEGSGARAEDEDDERGDGESVTVS